MHENFALLAQRLIGKNGRVITVRRTTITPSMTTPWDPSAGTPDATDYMVRAVWRDQHTEELLLALPKEPDQKTIVQREKVVQIFVAALDLPIDPTPDDTVLDTDGRQLEIVRVTPIKPGETTCVWIFEATR